MTQQSILDGATNGFRTSQAIRWSLSRSFITLRSEMARGCPPPPPQVRSRLVKKEVWARVKGVKAACRTKNGPYPNFRTLFLSFSDLFSSGVALLMLLGPSYLLLRYCCDGSFTGRREPSRRLHAAPAPPIRSTRCRAALETVPLRSGMPPPSLIFLVFYLLFSCS